MGVRSQAQNLVVESLTPLFCLMDLLYHFCLIFSIFPSSSSELNSKSQILYDYTLIPENADMDSYRSYGAYGCPSNNVASTLKNDPFQTAFKLSVENSTGVNDKYPCQIYRRLYDGAIAYRYLNDSNEWSNYYYITPNK